MHKLSHRCFPSHLDFSSMLHAFNLALRFELELLALVAVGYWGFILSAPLGLRLLGGFGLPLLLDTAWAVFRVPGDGASRSW